MDIPVVIGPIAIPPVANSDYRPPVIARGELGVNVRRESDSAPLPLHENTPASTPAPAPQPQTAPAEAPAVNAGGGAALFEAAVIFQNLPPPPPLPSAAVELARLGVPSWVPPLSDLHLRDVTV